jgi:phosphatidylinositol 3-kinase
MVPDCITMYAIREKMRFSILNYIIEKNPHESIETIRKRFMHSCSAYCVITYLLGIGDRHLDNIMITNDGYMFHVDYGFVLGFDPKPMSMPQMRITDDMIDVLGGQNSVCYQEFKDLCNRIYNLLRGHVSVFLNLLTLLVEMDPAIDNSTPFTKEILKKEIMDRFIPGETAQEANLQLISHIENNSTYGQYVNDFFHYHAKENTIQKTLTNTVEGTKNILSSIYSLFSK